MSRCRRRSSRPVWRASATAGSAPPERIKEHFLGLPLVEPGLDFIPRWFPGEPDREVPAPEDIEPWHKIMMGGLGHKP